MREDEHGDSEDDELPCVIGGKSEGDCMWQGSQSSFHRRDAMYQKERFVIFKEARVTLNEERVL